MKKKHPLLKDEPTGTLPKRTPGLCMEDLMKRSEEALKKLKRIFDK
jgi:hypothetical protein